MTRRTFIPPVALLAASAAAAIALMPGAGQAAKRTQTLHVYEKQTSIKLTHADGSAARPPFGDPKPGDVLEINSIGFPGTHVKHAKRWTSSNHLVCQFGAGEPDCVSHFALGGSLLVISGNPGTVTNGTGIYQGASGRVLSRHEIKGTEDADVVLRIRRRS